LGNCQGAPFFRGGILTVMGRSLFWGMDAAITRLTGFEKSGLVRGKIPARA
jgi:hypothetical protein